MSTLCNNISPLPLPCRLLYELLSSLIFGQVCPSIRTSIHPSRQTDRLQSESAAYEPTVQDAKWAQKCNLIVALSPPWYLYHVVQKASFVGTPSLRDHFESLREFIFQLTTRRSANSIFEGPFRIFQGVHMDTPIIVQKDEPQRL